MSIRDNFRTKEEIFESDYITLGELSLFNNSYEEMNKQMEELIGIKDKLILNRFEILD